MARKGSPIAGLIAAALVTTAVLALWPPAEALATFPGQNGKLAFASTRDPLGVYAMEATPGSAANRLTAGSAPAWSPDGTRIAFASGSGIVVANADGTNAVPITSDSDGNPTWSPDGTRIAFERGTQDGAIIVVPSGGGGETTVISGSQLGGDVGQPDWSPDGRSIAYIREEADTDEDAEILVISAPGVQPAFGPTQLTFNGDTDLEPNWSPDGSKIAFTSDQSGDREIHVMNADGGSPGPVTTNSFDDTEPVWSPDGQKIAFTSIRSVQRDIFVMNANGSGEQNLTDNPADDRDADWQPIANCPDVQVGFATAKGCFTETAPGSGLFTTDQTAWVGGFEIKPRPNGELIVNTVDRKVLTQGAGADVMFAGFAVPIPVDALPVAAQSASLTVGGASGVGGFLAVPVEAQAQVAWTEGGKAATFEAAVKVGELSTPLGQSVGLGVSQPAGSLKASLRNGVGFVVQSGELSVDEISVIPSSLRIPRTLKLKNLLLRFEIRNDKPFWTGRAGIVLPLTRGDLEVTGTVFVFDGSPAGGGLDVDGINVRVLGPVFLQRVGGSLLFRPDFGIDLRLGATLGPRVQGKKLVSIDGQAQAGSLVSGCGAGPDPTKLQAVAKLAALEALEQAGLAEVDITTTSCIFPGASPAIEGTIRAKISFAADLFGYEGTQTGFISTQGASYEGAAVLKLPGPVQLNGTSIVSSVGLAACGNLGFFVGGFGYTWGQSGLPTSLSACDLQPFRVARPAARASGRVKSVRVPGGLPHAAFAARSAAGAPRVRVRGPGGFTVSSPANDSPLRSRRALILPVAAERTTYVVVNDPRPGAWRVEALDAANPVTGVRFAAGLPKPRIKARVATLRSRRGRRAGRRLRLTYRLERIPGQRVVFGERGNGIYKRLGVARGSRGSISFSPTLDTRRARRIEAEVIQNGFPRALLTVARFRAPALPRIARPKVKARRTRNSLTLSWARVSGAKEYLVDVRAGATVLSRVITPRRTLRLPGTPATGNLTVTVQALSEIQPPGRRARLVVRPGRRR